VEYPIHPACAVIPLPPQKEIDELAESIKQRGLLEPITVTQDQLLLDGRCRLKACAIAGVEVRTVIFEGDDPFVFVLDKNIRRRHLTQVQREYAVAELVSLQRGSNQYQRKSKRVSQIERSTFMSVEEAAEKNGVGVTKAAIIRARTVIDHAAPHVRAMVTKGEVKSYLAAQAVCQVPQAAQANWTAADVLREGRKVTDNLRAKRTKTLQPKVRKAKVDPYEVLYTKGMVRHLSDIKAGPNIPSPGSRGDQRIFFYPDHIEKLRDDRAKILIDMVGPIGTFRPVVEKNWQSPPEVLGAALKRLLAYQPKLVGGYNGEDTDFAAETRQWVKNITDGDKIRRAIEWLTGVDQAIKEALDPAVKEALDPAVPTST
jgi:hypothetical protein